VWGVTLLYNAADQVLSLTQMNGAAQVAEYAYGYDPNGNRISRTDAGNAVTPLDLRPSQPHGGRGVIASYVYNGDGTRASDWQDPTYPFEVASRLHRGSRYDRVSSETPAMRDLLKVAQVVNNVRKRLA
jgi:YD repeat-containing protein